MIGRPPISSCSFANAIIEPANEIEPINAESTIARLMSTFGAPGSGQDAVQLGERDECRRAAADAVEERHHLRHRGHLHAARRERAEAAADHHAERDLPVARQPALRERDRDRDEHAGGADLVAAPRMRRAREETQRQDEGHDRDQVEQVREVDAHYFSGLSRFLNISSMRSVTTKPPTTFADASTTATKPMIQVNGPL